MWKPAEAILAEWPSQVIASHALVIAQILAGEDVEADIYVHLAGELWAIAKLARLLTQHADFINEARRCWREAARAFDECAQQWSRLPSAGTGEPIEMHRRLLEQLCMQAADELELYTCDRLT